MQCRQLSPQQEQAVEGKWIYKYVHNNAKQWIYTNVIIIHEFHTQSEHTSEVSS